MQEQTKNISESYDNSQHSKVIALFALVGLSISALMGVVAIINNRYLLAGLLLIASFVYLLGYYVHQKFNNVKLSAAIILYSLYLLMFYLVYSGGVENTGPLWIFIVAPVSVFIHGLKRGLLDITIFVTIICAIMFIPNEIIQQATYNTEFKLRLLYSFLTVTFLSSLYEYLRNKSYKNALELSEIYQQLANLDPLTKLSNRRDALHILERERPRIVRNKEPLSIILCDVDHFKHVNDQYGHNAGDKVLVELAQLFTELIREQDSIARWGGEEFLFILPQTEAKNANIIAEKILNCLQNYGIIYQEQSIKVTISMGIEQLNANQSIDDVINSADKYLYQAKSAGRNQIFPKFK